MNSYVGGRYCHQTSSLFTIITKHIHHRETTKKKRRDRKGQELHENIQKRRIKRLPRKKKEGYTQKNIYTKKKEKNKKKKEKKTTTTTQQQQTYIIIKN